ncbi:ParA family protein [Enterovibrio norvegicus]|uniref:ParA family protein n=1 Tax=Enterovibrio norvegicus TaxID=188144 RepID=UPI000C859EEB|nr:ParA family protein [Enterovibrio norvegicus]PMH64455.1 hypothetical protein BCU62_15485 [Enterovibrio norvegicus]
MDSKQLETLGLLSEMADESAQLTSKLETIFPKSPRTFTRPETTEYLKCDYRTVQRHASELGINPGRFKSEGIDFLLDIDDVYRIREALPASTVLKSSYKPFIRSGNQQCQIIVVQNQKGGVGKTLSTITISTGLAIEYHQGYRVLVVDMDGQSTLTMYQPPKIDENGHQARRTTVGDLLMKDPSSADYIESVKAAVADTTVPNLKILPADQHDRQLEAEFHKGVFNGQISNPYSRLKSILDAITEDFDIVVIDTPPSFGFAALNSYLAATSVIFPLGANQNDVDATCQYFQYLPEIYKTLVEQGHGGYDFIRMLVTNYEESVSSLEVLNELNTHFPKFVFSTQFKKSEAVRICALAKNSVFDLSASTYGGTKKTFIPAKLNAAVVVSEVHLELMKVWKKQLEG